MELCGLYPCAIEAVSLREGSGSFGGGEPGGIKLDVGGCYVQVPLGRSDHGKIHAVASHREPADGIGVLGGHTSLKLQISVHEATPATAELRFGWRYTVGDGRSEGSIVKM